MKIQLCYTQTKWAEGIITCTNFKCKEFNLFHLDTHKEMTTSFEWANERGKCQKCNVRFNWKYNFVTHKPNEQRIYSPARILNAKNAILSLKKFEMRLRGLRWSEIPFKCKQCHFRFMWKYNFCTHKPNEQRMYSHVQILNAKNAI